MKGFEGFYSPLLARPEDIIAARRPWEGEKNRGSSKRNGHDPAGRRSAADPPTADVPQPPLPHDSQYDSQHPELAPSSVSSFGSVLSPGRESRFTEAENEHPRNNRELRRRLTAGSVRSSQGLRRAPQDFPQRDGRRRRWPPARACWCRICACLAIFALLGIIVLARLLITAFRSGGVALLPETRSSADGGAARPVGVAIPEPAGGLGSPASAPEVVATAVAAAAAAASGLSSGTLDVEQPRSKKVDREPELPYSPDTLTTTPPPLAAVETPPTLPTGPTPRAPWSLRDNGSPAPIAATSDHESEAKVDIAGGAASAAVECWIFMNMEKSGGGDARQIAAEHWRKDELVFDTVQWRRGEKHAADVLASHWKLLHGGCVEALRNGFGDEGGGGENTLPPCKWLTVFRHPVARLLSAYDHCQEAPRDPLCPPGGAAAANGGGRSPEDLAVFAERWGNFAVRQFALAAVSASAVKEWASSVGAPRGVPVWYLVKDYLARVGVPEDTVLEGLLQPVRDLVGARYAAVGIAAEPVATMRLFDRALAVEGLDWSSSLSELEQRRRQQASGGADGGADGGGENEAREREYDSMESAAFREALANPRIAAALRLDILLYEHAVQVFRQQLARYGVE